MSDVRNLPSINHPSLEEYRNNFFNFDQENRTLLDQASEMHDKIPTIIKVVVKNFEKTGLLSSIDELLSDHRNRREQNRIIEALYYVIRYNMEFATAIEAALEQHREEFLSITEFSYENTPLRRSTPCLGRIT